MSYVGEEDVSYNDLVDSMMQAWNGGILVANKKKNESKREEKDSSAEEGRSEPQGRIFSVPHSMLKQQTSKKREVGNTAPCSLHSYPLIIHNDFLPLLLMLQVGCNQYALQQIFC